MPSKSRLMGGYTLTELLVVLAMVGILAAVAAPSFAQQIKQSRLASNANHLHSIFKFARSEGAKRDSKINLVVSGNKWLVKMGDEVLNNFEPSYDSILVNTLQDIEISSTGATMLTEEFIITDNDASTDDYYFCIYRSGQSKLSKGATCL